VILSVPDAIVTHGFAVGKWALVFKGVYKGDLGYVSRIEPWGGVTHLLVPHLQPSPSLKRKRPCTPSILDPALVQPGSIQKIYGITPSKQAHETYHFNGFVFKHRPILKPFDLHSISSAFVLMSPTLAALFAESGHPSIPLSALIPRPLLKMMFSQGEKVAVLSSWERGIVEAVHRDHVEVRLSGGAGTVNIPGEELHKDLVISDFIQVLLEEQKGKMGWVQKIDGDTTHVTHKNQGITKMLQWEVVLVISEDYEIFTLLCNLNRDLTIGELIKAESGPYQGQMGQVVKVTSDAVHILQEALDVMEVEQLYYTALIYAHITSSPS